jgi:hypothetical protein
MAVWLPACPAVRTAPTNLHEAAEIWGYTMGTGNEAHIADREFIKRMKRLRRLRDFILSEGIQVAAADQNALILGHLNRLRFSRNGRAPTDAEWDRVDNQVCALFQQLPAANRKKYVLREYPYSITVIAVLALALSIVAFFLAIFPSGVAAVYTHIQVLIGFGRSPDLQPASLFSSVELFSFILWVVCLSALGSVAFISVNALSIQDDATFDITNGKFVWLRIVLGILFGVIVALPSSYQYFLLFTVEMQDLMAQPPDTVSRSTPTFSPTQIAILIVPFLIGFSASLFMAIITRMVSGIQSMFGIDGRQASSAGLYGGGPAPAVAMQASAGSSQGSILGGPASGPSILSG